MSGEGRIRTKYIYTEYHSVCPLVRIGSWVLGPPPAPSPASECVVYQTNQPTNQPKGGHSPAGEGVAGSQLGRLEKKPSNLLLWGRCLPVRTPPPSCKQASGQIFEDDVHGFPSISDTCCMGRVRGELTSLLWLLGFHTILHTNRSTFSRCFYLATAF